MDKRFEYYKEQYYFELNRKSQLTTSMSIPIAFMTAIFSACAYFGLNINCLLGNWTFWIFSLIISVAMFFIIKASSHLYKAFTGLDYGYTPSPNKLFKYEEEHKNDPNLDDKFAYGIKKSYVNTTTKNRLNNNFRANHLYKTNVNTIKAIVFIILAAIPFFIGKNHKDLNSLKTKSLIKNQIIMTPNDDKNWLASENEVEPSDLVTSDFPVDEYITESAEIDIPIDVPVSNLPLIETNDNTDTTGKEGE